MLSALSSFFSFFPPQNPRKMVNPPLVPFLYKDHFLKLKGKKRGERMGTPDQKKKQMILEFWLYRNEDQMPFFKRRKWTQFFPHPSLHNGFFGHGFWFSNKNENWFEGRVIIVAVKWQQSLKKSFIAKTLNMYLHTEAPISILGSNRVQSILGTIFMPV